MFFAESIEDAANIRSSTDAQGRTQLQRQAMAAPGTVAAAEQADQVRTPVNNSDYFPPNFEGLVLGCIDADFCK